MDSMPIQLSSLSASKQARIDIWRNEVAVLASPTAPPSSHSTYSSSSSTGGSSSSFLAPFLPGRRQRNLDEPDADSRVRRIWSRIGRRLSARPNDTDAAGDDPESPQTAMYASLLPSPPTAQAEMNAAEEDADGDVVPGEGSDADAPRGSKALQGKQDRLRRAAKLLNQGLDTRVVAAQ